MQDQSQTIYRRSYRLQELHESPHVIYLSIIDKLAYLLDPPIQGQFHAVPRMLHCHYACTHLWQMSATELLPATLPAKVPQIKACPVLTVSVHVTRLGDIDTTTQNEASMLVLHAYPHYNLPKRVQIRCHQKAFQWGDADPLCTAHRSATSRWRSRCVPVHYAWTLVTPGTAIVWERVVWRLSDS
jgi:hypothetical protein